MSRFDTLFFDGLTMTDQIVKNFTPDPEHPLNGKVFMGLDLSLTSTGVGIFNDGQTEGYLIKPRALRGPARLRYLRDCLTSMLNVNDPYAIMIEGYSFGSKGQGTIDRAEWGGVVRLMLADRGIPTSIVAPQQLKKFISGAGNTEKAAIPLHLFKRFGVHYEQNDMADAVGAAILNAANHLPQFELIKPQIEAMEKIQTYLGPQALDK